MDIKKLATKTHDNHFFWKCPFCYVTQVAEAGYAIYHHECDHVDDDLYTFNGHILTGLNEYLYNERQEKK